MDPAHSLLKRQVRRYLGEKTEMPEAWQSLLGAVDEAYRQFDIDRAMLERSLDLSSQELLQANSELRAIFQAIPDLLFRIDADGKILACKAGMTGDLLLRPQEFIGKRIQDVPVALVRERFEAALAEMRVRHTVVGIEYALPTAGGVHTYEARLVPMAEGQTVVIIRNITERVQTESAWRKAEEKYRNIVENAVQGIFQSAPSGRIVEANPALARMLGYDSPAELMTTVSNLGGQLFAEPQRYLEFVRQLEANGVVQRFEALVHRSNGRPLWISLNARLVRGADGQVQFYEGIVEDITERKGLEEQLRQAQKMDAFGLLAGGVAHDFNNLLTVIQGHGSMLSMGELPEAERTVAVHEILAAAERASNLTRQLLTFSRRQPVQLKEIDLNEVVAAMTRMFQRIIGEHIALETRYAPGGTLVLADRGMMEQALMNLAVNSRDAMPHGGQLLLETTVVGFDNATAALKPKARPGSYVRVTVRDTGTGIATEVLPHIFEPFFTTKEVGRGTGLGLATVFGIVEQHTGWIEVESKVGQGTAFQLFLPRLMKSATDAVPAVPAMAAPGGSESILLVEDEAPVRTFLRSVLERRGYRVVTATSGVEACALWEKHHAAIELLITDMVMPGGMNGRELAARLQAEKPTMKVIFCSGYTDEALGRDTAWRQQVTFLEKPFDHNVLLRLVRECLDTTASHRTK